MRRPFVLPLRPGARSAACRRKGACVAQLDGRDAREIYTLRVLLERYMIRLAVERATDAAEELVEKHSVETAERVLRTLAEKNQEEG